METIALNSGVEMPALGLGVFQTPPDETRDAVRSALDGGYRHSDTAAAYGNEREVGEAVHSCELDRSEVFLETKIWISDYGYDETLHGFEKSARKPPRSWPRSTTWTPAVVVAPSPRRSRSKRSAARSQKPETGRLGWQATTASRCGYDGRA
jgi:hypothetical protein